MAALAAGDWVEGRYMRNFLFEKLMASLVRVNPFESDLLFMGKDTQFICIRSYQGGVPGGMMYDVTGAPDLVRGLRAERVGSFMLDQWAVYAFSEDQTVRVGGEARKE